MKGMNGDNETSTGRQSQMITGFLPIADLLNFLSDLVSPEGDEKHDAFAYLALKLHRSGQLHVLLSQSAYGVK